MYKVLAKNPRVSYEYFIIQEYEAGISLLGPEVKSIRLGMISLRESYVVERKGCLGLTNCHVAEYKNNFITKQDCLRFKPLLLHKKEINKLIGKVTTEGMSIVPLCVYCNHRGLIKVKIALVKGKKLYDKRQSIKEKDIKRELARNFFNKY